MNTYELKTNVFGEDYLEMTSPAGKITFVPMVASNSDYQTYLKSLEISMLKSTYDAQQSE